jgi:hypothetical protein
MPRRRRHTGRSREGWADTSNSRALEPKLRSGTRTVQTSPSVRPRRSHRTTIHRHRLDRRLSLREHDVVWPSARLRLLQDVTNTAPATSARACGKPASRTAGRWLSSRIVAEDRLVAVVAAADAGESSVSTNSEGVRRGLGHLVVVLCTRRRKWRRMQRCRGVLWLWWSWLMDAGTVGQPSARALGAWW